MKLIDVTPENLAKEHICCAISDKKGEDCVASKKAWMEQRFPDGLVFKKLDVRGKVFIEYLPAEAAWCPIEAEGCMHINCLWVSGRYKGQGYAGQLLEACIADAKAKGKRGLTALSSAKKMPFLSEPKFLKYKGFVCADSAPPSYELLYLPFDQDAPLPRFRECAKKGTIEEQGLVLYYSNQCPHTSKYVPLIQAVARGRGTELKAVRFETAQQAQQAPAPFTTYSLFYNGGFITNEILSQKKFEAFLDQIGIG